MWFPVFQMIQSKVSGSLLRDHHVLTGYHCHTLFLDVFHDTSQIHIFKCGPFQIDFGSWIHHLGTQSKRIDICDRSKNRIVSDIGKLPILCHCSGDRSHQEFCLMHTCIIGTDITVWSIQRTVHDSYLRIFDCGLYAGFDKLRCRCKDEIAALLDRIRDCFFCELRSQILITLCCDLIREGLLKMKSSQFMCISPRGCSRCLGIKERNFEFRCT